MRKAALLVLMGVISVLLADCIVSYPTFGPPELRAEVTVGGPRPGYIWIGRALGMVRRQLCLDQGALGQGQAWADLGARTLGTEGSEVGLAGRSLEVGLSSEGR